MPILYEVNKLKNQVHAHLVDELGGEDIISFTADLIQDRNVGPGFSLLLDAASVSPFSISMLAINYVLELESIFPEKFIDSRRAYLFDNKQQSWWALELQNNTRGNCNVFYNRNEAHSWLERD